MYLVYLKEMVAKNIVLKIPFAITLEDLFFQFALRYMFMVMSMSQSMGLPTQKIIESNISACKAGIPTIPKIGE